MNKYDKDPLGSRMKENYENRTRFLLPRRTYTIARLDGKGFHQFCKGMSRPYDVGLMNVMDYTALNLCKEISGAEFAFVQSDEIQILITDFKELNTEAWFDYNIQKLASVTASIATAHFNSYYKHPLNKLATFDSRVFTISDREEVANSFIWRQNDCSRNSISMTAQSLYSHSELQCKKRSELQEMCFQKGTNWNDLPSGFRRGRVIFNDKGHGGWQVCQDPAIFTQDRQWLMNLIPVLNNG